MALSTGHWNGDQEVTSLINLAVPLSLWIEHDHRQVVNTRDSVHQAVPAKDSDALKLER